MLGLKIDEGNTNEQHTLDALKFNAIRTPSVSGRGQYKSMVTFDAKRPY